MSAACVHCGKPQEKGHHTITDQEPPCDELPLCPRCYSEPVDGGVTCEEIWAALRLRRAGKAPHIHLAYVRVEALIRDECASLAAMLVEKNRAYGNSALDPVRVFSKASAVEQILVRIDDKLSRLSRGQAGGEDVVLDLIGYLVLLRIARRAGLTTGGAQ